MELFDLLEKRVEALLQEISQLRDDNCRLREEASACQGILEENFRLQEELKQMKGANEQVLTRIDALVRRIQDSQGSNA